MNAISASLHPALPRAALVSTHRSVYIPVLFETLCIYSCIADPLGQQHGRPFLKMPLLTRPRFLQICFQPKPALQPLSVGFSALSIRKIYKTSFQYWWGRGVLTYKNSVKKKSANESHVHFKLESTTTVTNMPYLWPHNRQAPCRVCICVPDPQPIDCHTAGMRNQD